jgi:hypothetical protein
LHDKVLPSAGTHFIASYTRDIINEVNDAVLNYVISGVFQKPQYRNLEKAKQQQKKNSQKENKPMGSSLSPNNLSAKKNLLQVGDL